LEFKAALRLTIYKIATFRVSCCRLEHVCYLRTHFKVYSGNFVVLLSTRRYEVDILVFPGGSLPFLVEAGAASVTRDRPLLLSSSSAVHATAQVVSTELVPSFCPNSPL
jgi:hypothetical protein